MKEERRLILVLVLSIVSILVNAESSIKINGIYYVLNNSSLSAEVSKMPSSFDGTSIVSNYYSGDITIPEEIEYEGKKYTITSVGEEAFNGCTELLSISMPNTVINIGEKAFQDCRSLKTIDIPKGIEIIKDETFAGMIGITSIVIPESVVRINKYAFMFCSNLKNVYIDGLIQQIGDDAFFGCDNIENVYIKDLVHFSGLYLWTIYSSPLSYAKHMYLNGQEIVNLRIPEEIDYVSRWAFLGCDFLESVTIPNHVRKIEQGAFAECSNLKILIIGEGVYHFGDYAFQGCNSLTDVYCYSKERPNQPGYNMFQGCDLEKATLHVPEGGIDGYKESNTWNKFGKIVPLELKDPSPFTAMLFKQIYEAEIKDVYSVNGEHIRYPAKGINIIKYRNGEVKKVIIK